MLYSVEMYGNGLWRRLIYKYTHMEPNQIKDADILDIIFEGRNKEYGAYELRKTYNNRIVKSMIVMGSMVALLVIGNLVSGFGKKGQILKPDVTDITLDNVKEDIKQPVIPPPPVIKAPPVAMIRFVTTRIIPDKEVPKDEKPPVNDDVDKAKIGMVNTTGAAYDGTDAPVATGDGGKGLVEAPKRPDDDDGRTWYKVETDAAFPGGPAAWLRFLNRNLRVPDEAMSIGISGQVVVQFIVDKDGNVSDVEAISGPERGGLREEAVRVIRKSGKWTPALQNGRYVKAYRKQPVTFVIGE
jgi:protein TonB